MAYINSNGSKNLLTASQLQNVYYQQAGRQSSNLGYNQLSVALLPQTLLSLTGTTRNLLFDIPTPRGSTPGPAGLAGSPTVGVITSPTVIGNISTAGTQ
jgi:hypothetical protein